MKFWSLSAAVIAVCFLAGSVRADDKKPEGAAAKGERPGFDRAEFMKKFDKDGDGQLSDAERTAAREEFAKNQGGRGNFREELLKRFDKDGDGKLSEEEMAAAREARAKYAGQGGPNREEILKKFDANGNGQLDQEERQKAYEEFRKNRAAGDKPAGDKRPAQAEKPQA